MHLRVDPQTMASGTHTSHAGLYWLDSLDRTDARLKATVVYIPPGVSGNGASRWSFSYTGVA